MAAAPSLLQEFAAVHRAALLRVHTSFDASDRFLCRAAASAPACFLRLRSASYDFHSSRAFICSSFVPPLSGWVSAIRALRRLRSSSGALRAFTMSSTVLRLTSSRSLLSMFLPSLLGVPLQRAYRGRQFLK